MKISKLLCIQARYWTHVSRSRLLFDCVFVCFFVYYKREGGRRELAAGALLSACIHLMLMYSICLSSKFTRMHSLYGAFSVLEIEDMKLVQLLTVFSLFCFPDCL